MALYLLLDGHSLAFRAWFALQETQMTTASGQETAAVYGFVGMLARLLEDHSPAGMAVAFDLPEPTFRDSLAADYKAGRAATPEPLRQQIGLIRRTVEVMGIPVAEASGFEADDVIATLATRLEAEGDDVIIVTGDRDTYQLVRDPHVRVLYNRRGVTDYVLYDEAGIEERTGVLPPQYPFLAALRGDPSDNLPGVPGVGEKTAAKLVNTYGDIDSLFAHLGDLTPKLSQSLAENEARVRLNFSMTPLVRDVELPIELPALRWGGSDREELDGLLNLLEIRAPRDRLIKALDRLELGEGAGPAAGGSDRGTPVVEQVQLTVLADADAASTYLRRVAASTAGSTAVEPEWAGSPGRSVIVGLAVAALPPESDGDEAGAGRASDGDRVLEVGWVPGDLLADPDVGAALAGVVGRREGETVGHLVAHRSKELMRALEPLGVPVTGLDLDTALAGYLADPRVGAATLERLAESAATLGTEKFGVVGEQLGFDVLGDGGGTEEAASGGPASDPVASAVAARLGLLAGVVPVLRRALAEAGAERLYAEIERPLVRVLAKMELAGIAVDVAQLEAISAELTNEADRLESEVHGIAGEQFNVNSTAQLRRILFDQLGLTPSKRTKTGYSTDAQSLEKLRGQHPIVDTLLSYREVEKLRSTYGTGLLSEVAPDGRIHASFNQTVARTGRLSSDQPNLHNIPVRSLLGRRFRQAFVPAPGCELLVADYDQIELRVIAHLAEDPGLIESFRAGLDIHQETASRIFGVEPDGVTVAMRSKAKMVSYGLAYGMEAYGLSQRLAIPVEEAAAILEQYFVAFPNVKEYMTRTVAEARARGYTETLFGRRRYLPELGSSNYRVRQAAERQAMNAGIQGLAADIFKVALVRLDEAIAAGGMASRIVLQVHDEVLVESRQEEAEEIMPLTLDAMTGAVELSVPLAVHVARGDSWAGAKEDPAVPVSDDDDLDFADALAGELSGELSGDL